MMQVSSGVKARSAPYSSSSSELKFLDAGDTTAITATRTVLIGAGANTLHPVQGTGDSERIGRCHMMKNVSGRITVLAENQDQTSGALPSVVQVRIALVLDTQANGTSASSTTIQEIYSVSGGEVEAFRNLDNVYRFKVLWEKTMTINNGGGAYDGTNAVGFGKRAFAKFNRNLNLKVHSLGTGGGSSDISDNRLLLIAMTEDNNDLSIQWNCRLRYSDA